MGIYWSLAKVILSSLASSLFLQCLPPVQASLLKLKYHSTCISNRLKKEKQPNISRRYFLGYQSSHHEDPFNSVFSLPLYAQTVVHPLPILRLIQSNIIPHFSPWKSWKSSHKKLVLAACCRKVFNLTVILCRSVCQDHIFFNWESITSFTYNRLYHLTGKNIYILDEKIWISSKFKILTLLWSIYPSASPKVKAYNLDGGEHHCV